MKVICLSILLLLATSAVAYIIDGVKPGDHHRRTRGVPGNNRALGISSALAATLKGGKGMGGMGMKSKKGAKGCQSLKIKSPRSEFEVEHNAVGRTIFFPIYDYYTDAAIGTYTSSITNIGDCGIESGSYNLGVDPSLEFPFEDQITVTGTCDGIFNAVTGGTGEYACASGYGKSLLSEEDTFATDLIICNTCT
jgi:hypothetical protein